MDLWGRFLLNQIFQNSDGIGFPLGNNIGYLPVPGFDGREGSGQETKKIRRITKNVYFIGLYFL